MEVFDEPFIQRQTLCIAGPEAGVAVHAGEDVFTAQLHKHYQPAESNVAERLVSFKNELYSLQGEAFWTRLMEGMTDICGGQFGFVSKRILVDDDKAAVEMPPIGEPGSCLMGIALYFNDGKGVKGMNRDYKYFAWSAPCAYMRYDKVFLIPEGLSSFITDNPNQLPFDCSAYLGVPLFAEGKCFAHFGMMWTEEGLVKKKNLSWTFIEMFLRSLEDLVAARVLAGAGFSKPPQKVHNDGSKVIPQSAITATQSLRPYARSLSHELRTPMQGVVGMLDVMYATVQEQIEGQSNNRTRSIFQLLKENIEVVQDSSKRAVEAADNVVQAYDLNMQIPDTPSNDVDSPAAHNTQISSYFDVKPNMIDGSKILHSNKRKSSHDPHWNFGSATKKRDMKLSPFREPTIGSPCSPTSRMTPNNLKSPRRKSPPLFTPDGPGAMTSLPKPAVLTPSEVDTTISTPASLRQCLLRDVISVTIQESLRVGGRPDSAVSTPIDNGERIEARSRSSNGYASQKIIEWTVQPAVPDLIPVDERDLSKLVSAVFLNAVKFTENGEIKLHIRLSSNKRFAMINVADTGIGIPETFQPELFKPFSQEDDSLTRTKEGLGLGLLVAKGLARRIGGDITLVRSNVEGPKQGSEFEIKVPLESSDSNSRSSTPFHSCADANAPRSTPATASQLIEKQSIKISTSKESSPLGPVSPSRTNTPSIPSIAKFIASAERTKASALRRTSLTPRVTPVKTPDIFDRQLAEKYPLTFLVAEDNKINRKLLVNMLAKLGYRSVHEAFDGREAVRVFDNLIKERQAKGTKRRNSQSNKPVIDVVLMDLWMPEMDGYQATAAIFDMFSDQIEGSKIGVPPTVLAVSADVTDTAIERATTAGMLGYMSKPYKLLDLQRLIIEFCIKA